MLDMLSKPKLLSDLKVGTRVFYDYFQAWGTVVEVGLHLIGIDWDFSSKTNYIKRPDGYGPSFREDHQECDFYTEKTTGNGEIFICPYDHDGDGRTFCDNCG